MLRKNKYCYTVPRDFRTLKESSNSAAELILHCSICTVYCKSSARREKLDEKPLDCLPTVHCTVHQYYNDKDLQYLPMHGTTS